jgi:SnoaL-like domain
VRVRELVSEFVGCGERSTPRCERSHRRGGCSTVLESRDEIANLIFLVDEALDDGRFDDLGALLGHARSTIAGTGSPSGKVLVGAAAVVDDCRRTIRIHDDGLPHTLTLTTNLVSDIDETAGRARVRSVFTVWQQAPGFALAPILGGANDDTFERVDGRWRFATRHMEVRHVGHLSAHVIAGGGAAS